MALKKSKLNMDPSNYNNVTSNFIHNKAFHRMTKLRFYPKKELRSMDKNNLISRFEVMQKKNQRLTDELMTMLGELKLQLKRYDLITKKHEQLKVKKGVSDPIRNTLFHF